MEAGGELRGVVAQRHPGPAHHPRGDGEGRAECDGARPGRWPAARRAEDGEGSRQPPHAGHQALEPVRLQGEVLGEVAHDVRIGPVPPTAFFDQAQEGCRHRGVGAPRRPSPRWSGCASRRSRGWRSSRRRRSSTKIWRGPTTEGTAPCTDARRRPPPPPGSSRRTSRSGTGPGQEHGGADVRRGGADRAGPGPMQADTAGLGLRVPEAAVAGERFEVTVDVSGPAGPAPACRVGRRRYRPPGRCATPASP